MTSGHGDDRYQYAQTLRADFSSNVWFGGTPPELISHLQQNLHLIGNYPEPDAAGLCRGISDWHNVNPNQVLAFNGSVEAFYTIALAFRESVSAILYPTFAEYEDACRIHQRHLQFFRSDEAESALKSETNLFWTGNPNNPDGHIFSFQEIEGWLGKHPNTVFVVDEAYAGMVPGFASAISLTQNYPNLIVVRSLTKCCAIPGLRLGYVVASEKLASRLRKFQQPWSVNALAQEAGKFLIDYLEEHPLDTTTILQLSLDLQRSVGQLDGFHVIHSEAPFFLIEMQSGTAAGLKQFLLDEHGILVRDASNFRGLNERYFRVCTRNKKDNQLLMEGLKNYSKKLTTENTEFTQRALS
ncbi:MAG: aminotransferase class I/II-fold pyridoxal phosphate-dependent enzyme [Bacteroidota bacterium]|nr:aminotransferase class I/II-fold pyridoxal phosphate-dependent enzyme [Bacteroidota bacterium]